MKEFYFSKRLIIGTLLLLLLLTAVIASGRYNQANAAAADMPQPVSLEMHSIPSVIPGVNLSLREKHLNGVTSFAADHVVLLLEPFGVPAAEAFDAHLPGAPSLMDFLAAQGYDVWALDFRGFGASDRPFAFSKPPMANPPQMRAADAVLDVEAANNYIFAQRGVKTSNLLGWSWGSVVAAEYAGKHPGQVGKLIIYGGMHAFLFPDMTKPLDDPNNPGHIKTLPAYQFAVPDMTLHHWNMQAQNWNMQAPATVPHTAAAEAEMSRIFLASDPTSGTRTPPSIRRAMGPMVDLYEIWSGRPVFDASLIKSPTLIIRGSQDTFSNDPGFLAALTNAPVKKYLEIPQATHWALYEPLGAPRLMGEISAFLAAGSPAQEQTQPVLDQLSTLLNTVLAPAGQMASQIIKQSGL